ncbi:MAG: GatB/YqeY domain-containing protein, partial [Xanthomonadaceae bacterium]|nr:GatB/YqeY domain-containing protein [Xanthomonadaceae bacterium]
MSDLKARITEDMKIAMKGGDKPRLGVIRLILAALKQREVDERIVLDDTQVLHTLEKMLKQRRDSITQYEAAQREDLAAQERYEIGVIETYLPKQLGDAELDALIVQCIGDAGATS